MNKQPTIGEVYKRPEYFDAVWSESIECYGVTKQSIVCMEECAELIEAYDVRRRDGLTDGTHSHIVEEMADVLICLWLLEHMYDIKGRDMCVPMSNVAYITEEPDVDTELKDSR